MRPVTAVLSTTDKVVVRAPDGSTVSLPVDGRLTFGRGQDADLFVPAGRDLSRNAGQIVALAAGAWVENLSRTHALYVRGDDYHVRLPSCGDNGPPGGWLISRGVALVGSMAMIRQDLALRVIVRADADADSGVDGTGCLGSTGRYAGRLADRAEVEESTSRPLAIRPDTKLYLIALLLCRPWLADPSHSAALPTAPQIARAALECASASLQLDRFDSDPAFRTNLIGQVNDHLKYLRERIQAADLVPGETRLTPAVLAHALLVNDVIKPADLACLDDPQWRSAQENLWWKPASGKYNFPRARRPNSNYPTLSTDRASSGGLGRRDWLWFGRPGAAAEEVGHDCEG